MAKYVPKVTTLHQVCENNYVYLLRLLPDCDTLSLRYEFNAHENLRYSIAIVESSRYTSLLEIEYINGIFKASKMRVRLYHDAKMAEVISVENVANLQASYPYPNDQMHQVNEKEMINYFLAEWLSFCLRIRAQDKHAI